MIITHIISNLNRGGAEGVLFRLSVSDKKNEHIIISLTNEGFYGPILKSSGIKVYTLNIDSKKIRLKDFLMLFKLLKNINPNIIQTWMYHADFFGGITARLAGFKDVFWNIRHTTLTPNDSKRTTILIAKLCARLSKIIPKRIICCAESAMDVHINLGYSKKKMIVISNGYDVSLFKPSKDLKFIFRKELTFDSKTIILGMVGRFHPQKNHLGLLRSLAIVKKSYDEFKFLLIGRNLDHQNLILNNEIKKQNLESNIILLNQRSDVPAVMNALDINVLSSSSGEGFPNVLAEAMSCGTPCVTTNVGDAALIVHETGWVSPPNDSIALANSIIEAIKERNLDEKSWNLRRENCRNRIVENFSLDKMIENYHLVWDL